MKKLILGLSLSATLIASAQAEIAASDAYVRAVPPGQTVSAAFMTLNNNGDQQQALVKASSSAAKTVELHTHTNVDGVMQMREVPEIPVAGNASTDLKPGGYHVMLIDLVNELNEGDAVELTLTFDDGSTANVSAPVKNIAKGGMKMMKADAPMKEKMGMHQEATMEQKMQQNSMEMQSELSKAGSKMEANVVKMKSKAESMAKDKAKQEMNKEMDEKKDKAKDKLKSMMN